MRQASSYASTSEWKEHTNQLLSQKKKYFKINFMERSLSEDINSDSRQTQKIKQHVENVAKDNERYTRIKDTMKKKFFHIRITREHKLSKSPFLTHRQHTRPEFSSSFQSSPKKNLTTKKQYSNEVQNLLNFSSDMKQTLRKRNIRTQIQLNRKNKQAADKQKALIKKFIRNSSYYDEKKEKKWEDISNREKYSMDYTTYLKKKTLKQIEKDVYERKIRKKTMEMQKFQDFILQQVKFKEDHKEKLSQFFVNIRHQFQRVHSYRKR